MRITIILRRLINKSDSKKYMFGILFLKCLSKLFIQSTREVKFKEGDDSAWYDLDERQFFVPEHTCWTHIQIQTHAIGNAISQFHYLVPYRWNIR